MTTADGPSKAFHKTSDGSLEDRDGNIIFFSLKRFVDDICGGNHCFLCGAHPDAKEFNNEHVIPRWLLRKLDLFDRSITLPNDIKIKYGRYTVPCCRDCNSFLGSVVEEEIKSVLDGGIEAVNEYIQTTGPWKIFIWLSLIFFKTHLKDTYLRKHLDRRKGEETIANDYDWGLLHHIHCIARAIQSGVSVEPECFGTTLVLPAKVSENYEFYDYRDVYEANTILLRISDVALLAVLDDSCAALNFFSNHFKKINGPLSPIQLREVLSHLTLLNYKLKYRPSFFTRLDTSTGEAVIGANLPESMELDDHSREELGEILYANVSEYVSKMNTSDKDFNEKNIRSGNYHFLFDDAGNFISDSMELQKDEN